MKFQIRPHFLINAFNLIYNLAQERDVSHIQEIMLYLSDYFRHIFRSNRDLELFGKEQKLIEGYINMAQIRYPDSIIHSNPARYSWIWKANHCSISVVSLVSSRIEYSDL